MWAIEARNCGENADYFYMSGLTEAEAGHRHNKLADSGEWAMVRSWDKNAEWEQEQANERIRNWKKETQ